MKAFYLFAPVIILKNQPSPAGINLSYIDGDVN